ncbi:DNA polymerase III subunit psi [Methylophaga sp.]|jgi:DNA polymerase III psi subunit|uniref:DNA polymerase III subunit psi n=1 Tax=Methylophaga sp. TaxID=2024840 RepID=UPI0014000658|nr:DNA polymerase III subunit psi [Methylophaga sp.]MTI64733.1 DNA polymerase III subunit psi [Methylophaga sp.]
MQLSNSQQRILADMGIQRWALRREAPVVSHDQSLEPAGEAAAAAISVDAQTVLLLVMDETRLSDAAQRLLNAMLKAVSLRPEQVTTLSAGDFAQVDTASLANKAVLLLGTAVTAQLVPELSPEQPQPVTLYQARFSACFSLEEMLQRPQNKAAAWRALQQLRIVF